MVEKVVLGNEIEDELKKQFRSEVHRAAVAVGCRGDVSRVNPLATTAPSKA